MHLRAPENDTTPRQEPYRRHEGFSVTPGNLPEIVDGHDGLGEGIDPAWPTIDDDTLAAFAILCAEHARKARELENYAKSLLTKRENARQQAIDAERARIRAWADEVQANLTRALGVA